MTGLTVSRDEYRLMSIAADAADRVLRGHGRPDTVIEWALSCQHVATYPDGTFEAGCTVAPREMETFRRVVYLMVAGEIRR